MMHKNYVFCFVVIQNMFYVYIARGVVTYKELRCVVAMNVISFILQCFYKMMGDGR